jgi:hypothetical protein
MSAHTHKQTSEAELGEGNRTIFLQRDWYEDFGVNFVVVLHIWSCAPLPLILVISGLVLHLLAAIVTYSRKSKKKIRLRKGMLV